MSTKLDETGLVTSQNVTAPKQRMEKIGLIQCLVTSQNVTAPKPVESMVSESLGLVTSQNVTAPKPMLTRQERQEV